MAVPPAPDRVPSQRSLVPSVTSVTSVANNNGDNEMIPEPCTDLMAFALKLRKISARRPSDEGAGRPVIASNGIPFLQMRSVGSHSMSGREKEGNKERMGSSSVNIAIDASQFYEKQFVCSLARKIIFLYLRADLI